MKQIKAYISLRSEQYEQTPAMCYLNDTTIPAKQRLSFLPHAIYFVMTFADVNRFLLPDKNSDDPIQKMINVHGAEDDKHWAWCLQDIIALDENKTLSFVDAVKFIWSKQNVKTRLFSYKLVELCSNTTPLEKLIIVETLETMGYIWFKAVANVVQETATPEKLIYLGKYHFEREIGHTIGTETSDIEEILIPDNLRNKAKEMIDTLFVGMEAFNQELLIAMQKQVVVQSNQKAIA